MHNEYIYLKYLNYVEMDKLCWIVCELFDEYDNRIVFGLKMLWRLSNQCTSTLIPLNYKPNYTYIHIFHTYT